MEIRVQTCKPFHRAASTDLFMGEATLGKGILCSGEVVQLCKMLGSPGRRRAPHLTRDLTEGAFANQMPLGMDYTDPKPITFT